MMNNIDYKEEDRGRKEEKIEHDARLHFVHVYHCKNEHANK
jgi:hypothetical protein